MRLIEGHFFQEVERRLHMNVKEVAHLAGISHQAVYKRIKSAGFKVDELKDSATGHFTPEGEAIIRELFNLAEDEPELTTDLSTKVAELTTEVEKLRNQVATLEAQAKALTEERDFLRVTLEHAQQLQAATLAKLPTPPPALPDGSRRGGLRGWWARIRGKDE